MHAFDFLNTKHIIARAFSDKRTPKNKTAYPRFRALIRGEYPKGKLPIEDYEIAAFYEQYKRDDKAFREFMNNLSSKSK